MEFLLPDDIMQRAVVMQTKVRFTSLHGDTNEMEKALHAALPVYRQAEHVIFQVWGQIALGLLRLMQGRLREGAEYLERAQQFAREHLQTRPETLLYSYISLCDVYRERNDLESAKTHLNDAMTLIRQTGRESYSGFVLENMKSLALMLDLCNDGAQADVLIDQSLRRVRRLRNEAVEKQLEALKAYLVLRRGEEMSAANRWAQSSGLSTEDKVDLPGRV